MKIKPLNVFLISMLAGWPFFGIGVSGNETVMPSNGLKLEYKLVKKSEPGDPGFVDYYTIWLAESFLRRDINNEVSTIIDQKFKIRHEMNHLTKAYYTSTLVTQPEDIHFSKAKPAVQEVQGQKCDVFFAEGQDGGVRFEIKIWITKENALKRGGSLIELLTNQSLDSAFSGKVPLGIPLRFSVRVYQESDGTLLASMDIELLSRQDVTLRQGLFSVPSGYALRKP